jgi:hypothetical protein
VINEENGYPVPDHKITIINVTMEPSDGHKKASKRKSWKKSLKIHREDTRHG